MTDHLGSVRAVADSEGNVLETYDYYPYGAEFSDGVASGSGVAVGGDAGAAASDVVAVQSGVSDGATGSGTVLDGLGVMSQPYRFNGKESQKFAGLPYLDYGARFYHPLSSRWTTMDPMAEKYYSVSPYAFCSGNPVNFAIKREQNELAHFAEREQRKALGGLTLWIGMGKAMVTGKHSYLHLNLLLKQKI